MADSQKQVVQWFPGHMAKTRRLIKESLHLVDGVLEVIDSRIPYSSSNPELSELISGKPRIILLNKCDLADGATTKKWIEHYKNQGITAIPVDCRSGKGLNAFQNAVKTVLAEKIRSNEEKGMAGNPLRLMVVGIPNTGKSSFINRMVGAAKAKVADKAGVTRHNQWFAIGGGIELLDTPGVLWPKFDDPKVGDRLAFIGSVKDEVIDSELLAVRLLEVMCEHYSERLSERYKISDFADLQAWEVLELIGRKRGNIMRGGEIDTERTSVMLLDEYRGGKLGTISLESPEDL